MKLPKFFALSSVPGVSSAGLRAELFLLASLIFQSGAFPGLLLFAFTRAVGFGAAFPWSSNAFIRERKSSFPARGTSWSSPGGAISFINCLPAGLIDQDRRSRRRMDFRRILRILEIKILERIWVENVATNQGVLFQGAGFLLSAAHRTATASTAEKSNGRRSVSSGRGRGVRREDSVA